MKNITTNKLTILGYVLLGLAGISWFALSGTDIHIRFWTVIVLDVAALFSFLASLTLFFWQGLMERPRQDDGEPRSK